MFTPRNVRETLSRFGVSTSLTDREIQECLDFENSTRNRSVIVIGKCGAGKDTVGAMIRDLYGHNTDSMAYILKQVALVAFSSEKKDRDLLQGLSKARDLLPSVYLDNVWRRIIQRRKLTEPRTIEREFETPNQVISYIKETMFPVTPAVGPADIETLLQGVYEERFGVGGPWWRLFQPRKLVETFDPIPDAVVLTDCRFPNEFFLGKALGLRPVRVLCDEVIRIERLILRDGHVDPERFNHPSETALDFLWKDQERYGDVVRAITDLDNNRTLEDLRSQVTALQIQKRAA